MVRPDEELDTDTGAPQQPGAVDWAKVSESFDRHQVGRHQAPGAALSQDGLDQPRRIGVDTAGEPAAKPDNGAEPREPGASSLVRPPSAVSQGQFGAPAPADRKPAAPAEPVKRLLSGAEVDGFRQRWPEIKAVFVDDPRSSVQQADALVDEITRLVVRRLTDERARLESDWNRGEVSTEDLRQALHRYQVLFDRVTGV